MALPLTEIKVYSRTTTYSSLTVHKCILPVTDKCERNAQVMGDDYVRLSFNSETQLTLLAFDYIYYDGQFFFLKEDYTPKNIGSDGITAAYYTYNVTFWSVANLLEKFAFIRHFSVLPEGETQEIECDEPEVELNGNLDVFGQLVGESLEYLYTRINSDNVQFRSIIHHLVTRNSLGAFTNIVVKADTDMVTISFSGNFADFLTTITQQYTEPDKKVEWYITKDNVLHIDKCQTDSLLTLSDSVNMGSALDGNRTGGLTSVEYAQEQNPLPQYIIPYGSDRNIESKMGQQGSINLAVSFGKRLRLNPNTSYTVEQGKSITTDSACRIQLLDEQSRPIVNTGIELVKFYDDVYPQGHFCVDEVVETFKTIDGVKQPRYAIKASAVTNDYRGAIDYQDSSKKIPKTDSRLQGVFPIDIVNTETLSINFESGFLNGREFEVANKTTKDAGDSVSTYSVAFSIIADGDIKEGTLLPSGNCIPQVGDKFAIFNMVMPQYYIEQAKIELAKVCYKELLELYNTKPEIKCKTDEKEFVGMSIELGTQILVSSLNLNVAVDGTRSEKSRVIAFSHSLTQPNKIDFTLSSAISEGRLTGIEAMVAEQAVQLSGTQQRAINLSKRGWRDQSEMADMLDSLKTEMMLVGEEKYQFGYTFGIECSQDMSGHTSDTQTLFLHFTAGQIAHTQEPYISYANKGVWYLSEKTIDFVGTDETDKLTNHPDTPYYVYAVCPSNDTIARIELCEQRKSVEIDTDTEYLQLGILSSEFEDNGTHFRVFNRTNGYTAISGGTLTTEQIQDYNRNLIIDFQSNPPRIIARNSAEIIGNIRFKSFKDESGNEPLDDLAQDIIVAEQNAEAYANAIGEDLQKQIDGVVDSYFLEGVPAPLTYSGEKIVKPIRQPQLKWVEEYETEKGISWGNMTADMQRSLMLRHSGDTYTDVLKAVVKLTDTKDSSEPLWFEQGWLSIGSQHFGKTFAEQRSNSNTYVRTKGLFDIVAGHTIKLNNANYQVCVVLYDSEGKYQSNYGWSTTAPYTITTDYMIRNYPQYKYFSLLFKRADDGTLTPSDIIGKITHDYTGGDLTYPNAGHSWRFCDNEDSDGKTWHWHEIADSDAVLALQKAAAAQDTADGKRRVFTVQPTPPYDTGDMWAQGSGRGDDLLYCVTPKSEGQTFAQSDWAPASSALGEANAAKNAAANAQTAAENAQQAVDNVTADGIISKGTEKSTLKKEWQQIAGTNMLGTVDGSYKSAIDQADMYGVSTATLTKSFNTLKTAMNAILADMNTDYILSSGGTTFNTKDKFNGLWKTYYDAEIAVLNQVSDAIDSKQVGGENLIGEENPFRVGSATQTRYTFKSIIGGKNVPDTETTNPRCVNAEYLKNGATYIFSVERVTQERVTAIGEYQTHFMLQLLCLQVDNPSLPIKDGLSYTLPIQDTTVTKAFTVPNDGYNYRLRLTNGLYQSGSEPPYHGRLTFYNMMLQEGEKKTEYQSYVKHLSDAIAGTTDIAGGLVMTNVLMLKNEQNQVTAGMSGLQGDTATPENVLLWGGGDYRDALKASTDDYKKVDNTLIQTLIKKDGTGKIGCFRIVDNDTVSVDNGGMRTLITTKSINDLDVGSLKKGSVKITHETSGEFKSYDDYTLTIPLSADSFYSIQNLMISISSNKEGSMTQIAGKASAHLVVKIGNVVLEDISGNTVEFDKSVTGISRESLIFKDIERAQETAQNLTIKVTNMQAYYGRIYFSFDYIAGDEKDFRMCVIAKDGLMISSGHNRQFFVKPSGEDLHFLCNLPQYSNSLQLGELYVDDAGFIRQRVEFDDSTSHKFELGKAGARQAILDLSNFYTVILPPRVSANLLKTSETTGSSMLTRDGDGKSTRTMKITGV